MWHKIALSLWTMAVVFLFFCCKKNSSEENEKGTVLVRIGDKVLTRGDLEREIPDRLKSKDSALFADNFIKRWVDDQLLYEVASRNIPDKENIDRMVERYRQELVIFEYQKHLLNEKLDKEISEEDMSVYYEKNRDKFKLHSAIIKGLFLKVPENSPQIARLKKWYKSVTPEAVENIEKYGLHNAVIYEYFYDKWVSFDEIMDNIPYSVEREADFLRTHKNIELNHKGYWYFLNISDYQLKGGQMPFDFAKAQIKEILINQKKMDFLKEVKEELYRDALKEKEVEYFN
ncbi:peptidyl-prolyl cis-trans isomerase [uncultured Coprobacter sp.]|uniref:peptidyl-prolyl cis-trans isomerase n=1 Tax=uncultured Coprobacter sp. TaxID=1720550 RepID=UPI0026282CEA|nr:peptidyl-prolyl cis-trans isomerase [uncultured Coprobacter sp.]